MVLAFHIPKLALRKVSFLNAWLWQISERLFSKASWYVVPAS